MTTATEGNEPVSPVRFRLSSEAFVGGLCAALALRGITVLHQDRFTPGVMAAYAALEQAAPARGLSLCFYLHLHPMYGDSTVLHDTLVRLGAWGLVAPNVPDRGYLTVRMSRTMATNLLARWQLEASFFATLVDHFLAAYEGDEQAFHRLRQSPAAPTTKASPPGTEDTEQRDASESEAALDRWTDEGGFAALTVVHSDTLRGFIHQTPPEHKGVT